MADLLLGKIFLIFSLWTIPLNLIKINATLSWRWCSGAQSLHNFAIDASLEVCAGLYSFWSILRAQMFPLKKHNNIYKNNRFNASSWCFILCVNILAFCMVWLFELFLLWKLRFALLYDSHYYHSYCSASTNVTLLQLSVYLHFTWSQIKYVAQFWQVHCWCH